MIWGEENLHRSWTVFLEKNYKNTVFFPSWDYQPNRSEQEDRFLSPQVTLSSHTASAICESLHRRQELGHLRRSLVSLCSPSHMCFLLKKYLTKNIYVPKKRSLFSKTLSTAPKSSNNGFASENCAKWTLQPLTKIHQIFVPSLTPPPQTAPQFRHVGWPALVST